MFVLIIVTYLGGSAWGPQVALQTFSSEPHCEQAREQVLGMVERMNGSNLRFGGATQREIVLAQCTRQ